MIGGRQSTTESTFCFVSSRIVLTYPRLIKPANVITLSVDKNELGPGAVRFEVTREDRKIFITFRNPVNMQMGKC